MTQNNDQATFVDSGNPSANPVPNAPVESGVEPAVVGETPADNGGGWSVTDVEPDLPASVTTQSDPAPDTESGVPLVENATAHDATIEEVILDRVTQVLAIATALEKEVQSIKAVAAETGPLFEKLVEEAKSKGLVGVIALFMQARKA